MDSDYSGEELDPGQHPPPPPYLEEYFRKQNKKIEQLQRSLSEQKLELDQSRAEDRKNFIDDIKEILAMVMSMNRNNQKQMEENNQKLMESFQQSIEESLNAKFDRIQQDTEAKFDRLSNSIVSNQVPSPYWDKEEAKSAPASIRRDRTPTSKDTLRPSPRV